MEMAFSDRQVMQRQDMEIFHYRQPYFKTLDFHSHDFYEFYVFLDGSVTYYIENNVYALTPGDILVIPPGLMHRPVIADEQAVYERIVLWVHPGYIHSLQREGCDLGAALQAAYGYQLINLEDGDFSQLLNTLHQCIAIDRQSTFGAEVLLRSHVNIMLLTLTEKLQTGRPAQNSGEEEGVVPRVIHYINQHLGEALRLDDLANLFFISKYHLIREFKKYTNATVYDYILAKRIALAKKLIISGESLTMAAQEAGFSEYSNFYKTFVKKVGVTPKEYRDNMKEKL